MQIDFLRQLEELVRAFGVNVMRLNNQTEPDTEFDQGLRKYLRYSNGIMARINDMEQYYKEKTLYIARDSFEEYYMSLLIPKEYRRGPLSLKLISEQVSVSSSYLSAQFKKETGKTLTDYINEKRIRDSLVLLSTTELPIQKVAERVGIYDENYYSRLFKKYLNQTAKQYRNMMNLRNKK